MTKPINEYTVEELSAKIKAIKAERERTANALKKYEEELERRKQEVPLGVPIEYISCANFIDDYKFGFMTIESQFAFSIRLNDYVKALQKLAKGEPIDIKALLPLMKKGWVAYCPISRSWFWTNEIPRLANDTWETALGTVTMLSWIGGFNLKPAENWKTSLMECGL